MTFTHADTAIVQATSSVSTQSVTLSAAVSVGDVICIVWGSPAPDSDTVSDNSPGGSQPWQTPTLATQFTKFAYAICSKAAPSGITITTTGGGSGTRAIVADRFTVSGGRAVFGNDAAHSGALSGTSGNLGSMSSVPAAELLWGGGHSDTASITFTAGSSNSISAVIGSQVGNTGGSAFSEYILAGAGGTESLTWTSNVSLGSGGGWEAWFITAAGPRQPSPVPRRRLARAVVRWITGSPPPVLTRRQPPGWRSLPPRRAVVQHVTGSPPPAGTPGTANRQQLMLYRARPRQRAFVRSVTGSPPAAVVAAVYRPQPPRPVSRRPSRAVIASIRPQPAPAVAVVPSGFQDRRPGYLKKRVLLGI